MLNCQALINEFLADYDAGTLPAARRLEFELHILLCPECRRYVDSYKKTIKLARAADAPAQSDVPPQLVDAILKVCRPHP